MLPLIGSLVSAFGRKPVLIAFILAFAVGSAISGSAHSMNMLIAGRSTWPIAHMTEPALTGYCLAVQGFGGGGCIAITEIVYADLVPLPLRGKYQGIQAS